MKDPFAAKTRRKLLLFAVFVVAFSGAITLLQIERPDGVTLAFLPRASFVYDAAKMWSVGLAGLFSLFIVDGSVRGLGFNLSRLRFYAIAIAVPLAYCSLIYVPLWNSSLAGFRGAYYLTGLLAGAVLHLPLSALLACGEEIGWRGVLVPALARQYGFKACALVSGVAWALWHWPDIIYLDYNNGLPIPYALTCFSLAVVGLGIFSAWLRLASGSLWPPIIAHALHNLLVYRVFDPTTVATAYLRQSSAWAFVWPEWLSDTHFGACHLILSTHCPARQRLNIRRPWTRSPARAGTLLP